jgi:hypothetical protein
VTKPRPVREGTFSKSPRKTMVWCESAVGYHVPNKAPWIVSFKVR